MFHVHTHLSMNCLDIDPGRYVELSYVKSSLLQNNY